MHRDGQDKYGLAPTCGLQVLSAPKAQLRNALLEPGQGLTSVGALAFGRDREGLRPAAELSPDRAQTFAVHPDVVNRHRPGTREKPADEGTRPQRYLVAVKEVAVRPARHWLSQPPGLSRKNTAQRVGQELGLIAVGVPEGQNEAGSAFVEVAEGFDQSLAALEAHRGDPKSQARIGRAEKVDELQSQASFSGSCQSRTSPRGGNGCEHRGIIDRDHGIGKPRLLIFKPAAGLPHSIYLVSERKYSRSSLTVFSTASLFKPFIFFRYFL